MKRLPNVAVLALVVVMLVLAGCTFQLLEAPQGTMPLEEVPGAAGDLGEIFLATDASYVVGEWICDQKSGEGIIRLDPDGRIIRMIETGDTVDIGYFWFADGDFHVMSDVDSANHESVFRAIVEASGDGVFLRLEQCGGDCPDAANINWLSGLEQVAPTY